MAVLLHETAAARAERPVDLELVMAIDASASITGATLAFQLQGHAAAFRDPAVTEAILSGPARAIAVTIVSWSGPGSLRVLVPWQVLDDIEAPARLADTIDAVTPPQNAGSTAIGSAVNAALPLFDGNGVEGMRKAIDLTSNGFSNSGDDPAAARDHAASLGVTVNALAILDEYPWLEGYFLENVIGGDGAFVRTADSRESFAEALLGKLIDEIAGLEAPPVPPASARG